jgi:pyruvate dehydrogenase E1 component alpha subunit
LIPKPQEKMVSNKKMNIPTDEKQIDRDEHVHMLRKMWEIRLFDQAAGRLYQKGMIKGGIHAYIGQEAIAVGVSAHLSDSDYITKTGYCRGRGGSMHVAAFDIGSLGAFPILASGVPSAIGAALSGRLLGKDYVVVTYFGEGTLAQGTVHECLNMAAVWKLPVVFVCENNRYAVSTHVDQTISFKGVVKLAAAYGITGADIDGQDVLTVRKVAGEAVSRARGGEGPTILHADTYRFEGHYIGEPQIYRSKDEVLKARQEMDPILLYQDCLLKDKLLGKNEIEQVEDAARHSVDEAVKFAIDSPEPTSDEYAKYVYA